MRRSRFGAATVLPLLALGSALATPPLRAQGTAFRVETPQLREGWHTVRPGETLETVTALYLGSASRWQDNWRLNPEVADPHRIYPGQRLRVLLGSDLPPDGALLFKSARRVEDQLLPLDWQAAQKNDLLKPRDSVRTHAKSSAELLFFDDTHLIVTEQSLVIVGETRRVEPAVDRTQIEIVLGQADLAGRAAPAATSGIEIVIGDATAKPRPNRDGVVETRARRAAAGGAQLMVYSGDSALAAGGQEVAVAQGMGTSAPEGAPPAPPEKLLDPPALRRPAAGAGVSPAELTFAWDAVLGASSYLLEVCHDPACGALIVRHPGITEASWRPAEPLEDAEVYYWRVTAVSASGLDGYPSPPQTFTLVGDDAPPIATVRLVGPSVAPRPGVDERPIYGPGTVLEVYAADAESGMREWIPVLDGEETTQEAWQGPWTSGEHTAAVIAVDQAGNRARSDAVEFLYDGDPPAFRWGVEGVGELAADVDAYAAPAGEPLPRRGRQQVAAAGRDWWVDSDFTQVVVRPLGLKKKEILRLAGVETPLRPGRGLWILAEDAICRGPLQIRYDLAAGADGAAVLTVEAADCVGNRARLAVPLAVAGVEKAR